MIWPFKKRKQKVFCWTLMTSRFDLSDKKFTEALILRVCHHNDSLEETSPSQPEPEVLFETLEKFADHCAASTAYAITSKALVSTDLSLFDFMPPGEPPKQAPTVVAFAIYVAMMISGELEADGLKLDQPKVIADVLNYFFMLHSKEDYEKYGEDSWRVYQSLIKAGSDMSNVEKWGKTVFKVVVSYVYSWTNEAPPFSEEKYQEVFGSLLKNLLSSVE